MRLFLFGYDTTIVCFLGLPHRAVRQVNFGLRWIIGEDMHPELMLSAHAFVHGVAQRDCGFFAGL